jgi:CheY-like chemotaxis protein
MEMLSALLLCSEPGTLGVTQKVLEDFGVVVRVAANAPAADQLMKRVRFDLGVLDCDVPGAFQLAGPESSHAPKMIFGLVRALKTDGLRGKRIHFVVQKPFSADLFGKSLRAAYGSMLRERRAAFRHPVDIHPSSCLLIQENGQRNVSHTKISDISQTGLCLEAREMLPQGASLQIKFPVPDSKDTVELTGVVMWNQQSGKTGVRFTRVEAGEQKKLNAWLESILPYDAELVTRNMTSSARQ